MSTEDDLARGAREYLAIRGVLEETFASHGGEIDALIDGTKIAKRLNRDYNRVMQDIAWSSVDAILWFAIYGVNGESEHPACWVARPLPHYDGQKFLCANGSDGAPWIPRETYAAQGR
jgi:hypothetical protein